MRSEVDADGVGVAELSGAARSFIVLEDEA
jgi:hypothetical protein